MYNLNCTAGNRNAPGLAIGRNTRAAEIATGQPAILQQRVLTFGVFLVSRKNRIKLVGNRVLLAGKCQST